jgi:NAD(P)-dependent dehydrogenase (short-subunit alcohol dehydrogenase family)
MLGEIAEEQFDTLFALNTRGTLFTVQKALPLFSEGGSIVLNGSIANLKAMPGLSVYSGSKAALRSFARTWVMELNSRGIRVNVLSPGPIETAIFESAPPERKEYFRSMIPRKELGRPEEIATVALFLASNDSSFVNGMEICVDGGISQI